MIVYVIIENLIDIFDVFIINDSNVEVVIVEIVF